MTKDLNAIPIEEFDTLSMSELSYMLVELSKQPDADATRLEAVKAAIAEKKK